MRLVGNTFLFAEYDLATAFGQIAWAGYSAAELHLASLDRRLLARAVASEDLDKIADKVRDAAESQGLEITSIESFPRVPAVINAMELASRLRVPTVTAGWAPTGTMDEALASFRPIIGLGERLNVRYALKAHSGFCIDSAAKVVEFIERVGSDVVRANYDPTHIFRANEDVVAVLDAMSPYIILSQFRDCLNRDERGPAEAQVAGRGAIPLLPALAALRATGYDDTLPFLCVGAQFYDLAQRTALLGEHKGFMTRCLMDL